MLPNSYSRDQWEALTDEQREASERRLQTAQGMTIEEIDEQINELDADLSEAAAAGDSDSTYIQQLQDEIEELLDIQRDIRDLNSGD